MTETNERWNSNQIAANCNTCGAGFVINRDATERVCPNCLADKLESVDDETAAELMSYTPESILPFRVEPDSLRPKLNDFMKGFPFRPRDLSVDRLMERIERVYMPLWWVDVSVKAQWQAEVGFDYDVVSHRMSYKGGWVQQEVNETRARWEPRVGLLERAYENVVAPALEDDRIFRERVGTFQLESAQAYDPDNIGNAIVRLPQREPDDAWSGAEMFLHQAAADQCREACQAQHIREYKWQAEFTDKHWTHLLLPVYVTFYFGADARRHWIIVNGQSGKLNGERVANLRSATMFSGAIFAAAIVLFILGALTAFISREGVIALCGGLAITASVLIALAAPLPMLRAWWFNRHQAQINRAALS